VNTPSHDLLRQYAESNRFRSGRPANLVFCSNSEKAIYLRSSCDDYVQDLYEYDVAEQCEHRLVAANAILQQEEQICAEDLARRERLRLAARGFTSFELSHDGTRILLPLDNQLFVSHRTTEKLTTLLNDGVSPLNPKFSPNSEFVACVRNGDLSVISTADNLMRQLTTSATENLTNGLPEFVAQEEMGRMEGYWWSPCGQFIAYQETDETEVEELFISDPFNPGRKPIGWKYPRAGTTNATIRLGVISVSGGATTWINWDREKYPYLATVKWPKYGPLSILVQNRAQTEESLLTVDHLDGGFSAILTERHDAWLNLDQSFPAWLPNGDGFLWMTERNGHRQLEVRNSNGAMIRALTSTDVEFQKLLHIESDGNTAWALVQNSPIRSSLVSVCIETAQVSPIDDAIPAVSDCAFCDTSDLVFRTSVKDNGQPSFEFCRRTNGAIQGTIGHLDSASGGTEFRLNREFTVVGSDPTLHCSLVRPWDYDDGQTYPVIVFVYSGPGLQVVKEDRVSYPLDQWIANQGFVVVSIDGRGTPGRGSEWERKIKGNFVQLPLQDQVTGLQLLGERYSELDLRRVGIFGWSFGGYMSAMAVMQRPDVFHVGVCGAPVCDYLDYDTHYSERYLGHPDEYPDAYVASNILTYAANLTRPLLLMHGTTDDNCYFSGSLRLSDRLFRSGIQHDFLPLAGQTHMVTDAEVTIRLYERTMEFFREHLLN
jgi:dipeptidyl-peptidase-4